MTRVLTERLDEGADRELGRPSIFSASCGKRLGGKRSSIHGLYSAKSNSGSPTRKFDGPKPSNGESQLVGRREVPLELLDVAASAARRSPSRRPRCGPKVNLRSVRPVENRPAGHPPGWWSGPRGPARALPGRGNAGHPGVRSRPAGRAGPPRGWSSPTRCRTRRPPARSRRRGTASRARRRSRSAELPMMSVDTRGTSLYSIRRAHRPGRLRRAWRALTSSATVGPRRHPAGEVDDRAVGHRHAHRDAVELALERGQHLADRAGGAGRRRDDVAGRRAAPPQVLVGYVGQALVVGVGMDGREDALLDAERLVQHPGDRRKAVRGARGVRDDPVLGPQRAVVDPDHDHGVDLVLGRHGEDHLARARLEVRARSSPASGRRRSPRSPRRRPARPRGCATGRAPRSCGSSAR